MELRGNSKYITMVLMALVMVGSLFFFLSGTFEKKGAEVIPSSSQPTIQTSPNVETIQPKLDSQWFEDTRTKIIAVDAEIKSLRVISDAISTEEGKVDNIKKIEEAKVRCEKLKSEFNDNLPRVTDVQIAPLDSSFCN